MTASVLKQLLALYFAIMYSWHLPRSEKTLAGKKVHPYILKILQISFLHIFFSFSLTIVCLHKTIVGYANRML